MAKSINITGKTFNQLTVIKDAEYGEDKCLCRCICGKEKYINRYQLISGKTKSCGCYYRNGKTKNRRLYDIWSNMIARCEHTDRRDSKYYSQKGITVCDEWKNNIFTFIEWAMANGYKDGLSIDRIDSNKGYEPSNCRWITIKDQQRNKENLLYFTFNGETKCLNEWAEIFHINRSTLHDRIFKSHFSFEEAINPNFHGHRCKLVNWNGENLSVTEFAKKTGIPRRLVYKRLSQGKTIEEIVKEIKDGRNKYSRSNKG